MAASAQYLIDLAVEILGDPRGGLKNRLYECGCPPPMLPMLTSMVTGASQRKGELLAVAEEAGLLGMPQASLPAGCPFPLEPPPDELVVVRV